MACVPLQSTYLSEIAEHMQHLLLLLFLQMIGVRDYVGSMCTLCYHILLITIVHNTTTEALTRPLGLAALATRIRAIAFFTTSVLISMPLFVVMVAIYPLVLLFDRHRYAFVRRSRVGGVSMCVHSHTLTQTASRARGQLYMGKAQHAVLQPSQGEYTCCECLSP